MKPVISPLYRVFWDGERFAHSFSPSFSRQPLDRSTLVLLRTLSYVCGTVKVGVSFESENRTVRGILSMGGRELLVYILIGKYFYLGFGRVGIRKANSYV